jgi:hypothetical protein
MIITKKMKIFSPRPDGFRGNGFRGISIHKDIYDKLVVIKYATGRSLAYIVKIAIEEFLKNLSVENEPPK